MHTLRSPLSAEFWRHCVLEWQNSTPRLASTPGRRNRNINLSKYFISWSGDRTHNQSILQSHFVPLRHDWPHLFFCLFVVNKKFILQDSWKDPKTEESGAVINILNIGRQTFANGGVVSRYLCDLAQCVHLISYDYKDVVPNVSITLYIYVYV